jgi:hypothetical protein
LSQQSKIQPTSTELPERHNVLIFPGGSEIAIEIFHSLRYNLHVDMFGASGKSDHASFLYDSAHYDEDDYYISSPDFIEKFNSLLIRWNIRFIFPTHDTITLFLKQHESELYATVIGSEPRTCLIAREKLRTYEVFRNESFCPKVYSAPYEAMTFPVFVKPNQGQGGKGAFACHSTDEFNRHREALSDMVVTELLPGEELSVDCFTDRKGKLHFIGPRTRERVQIGISFRSVRSELTDEIAYIANTINGALPIRGAWFFQIKKDADGKYKLLEFAVRQASTMGLYRQVGVNFALLSLFDAMDKDVSIIANDYPISLDRCLYNRYKIDYAYDKAYIDFDDTLIVHGEVNTDAVRFIYHCRNKGIKTILITKHRLDLDETLHRFHLSRHMFDEVIHLGMEEDKTNYMNPVKSIFIDNHFADRMHVQKKLGIPVFDVDAIDSLIENT